MLRRYTMSLVLAVLALAGCSRHPAASSHRAAVASPPAPGTLGSSLPAFSATGLRGNVISSSDLRGKVVLIDIWATWCQPCAKEMPGYQKLADRYGKDGLVVIGLKSNVMRDQEAPLAFAKRLGVHYPLVSASDDLIQKFGGLEGLPTTLLYDRHGVLQKKTIGFEYTSVFEDAVKSLM